MGKSESLLVSHACEQPCLRNAKQVLGALGFCSSKIGYFLTDSHNIGPESLLEQKILSSQTNSLWKDVHTMGHTRIQTISTREITFLS